MIARLRVGVVDDSAFNRLCLSEWIHETDDMVLLSSLENGEDALRSWLLDPPDVAVVDLEMPKMDGLTLVRLLMAKRPFPVVVFSSYSSSDNVVRALEAGALRFVAKPDSLVDVDATPLRAELLAAVREVARADVAKHLVARAPLPSLMPEEAQEHPPATRCAIVVTGTGGPQALLDLVTSVHEIPGGAWVALTHMPAKYIYSLAARLGAKTRVNVRVLEPDQRLCENTLYLAPPEVALAFAEAGAYLRVEQHALGDSLRWADAFLRSAAEICGARTSGALLTGGGDDGVAGLRSMLQAGCAVYLQDVQEAIVPDLVQAALASGLHAPSVRLGALGPLLVPAGA